MDNLYFELETKYDTTIKQVYKNLMSLASQYRLLFVYTNIFKEFIKLIKKEECCTVDG